MQHTKLKRLVRALKIPQYAAVGILESLWHLTAREAPEGNIGKLSNEDIATWIDWDGDSDALIYALVVSGWIDEDEYYRLMVHDWEEHADDATKMAMKRKRGVELKATVSELVPQNPTVCHKTPLPEPLPVPEPIKKVQVPSAVAVIDLPEWIDREVWNAYLEMRKKKRAVPTDRALKGILTQLGIFRNKGHDPNAVLDTSIRSNWTDVYEPKTGAGNGTFKGKTEHSVGTARDAIQEIEDRDAAYGVRDSSAGEVGQGRLPPLRLGS